MKRRLVWVWAHTIVFSNFWSIYLHKFFKIKVYVLHLREGVDFCVCNLNSNLGTILEVWHEKVYGPLTFLSGKDPKIVIDIGANIGTFSVYVAHKYPNVSVFAFEPEQTNYKLLEKNTYLNNLAGRIFTCQFGVCGTSGTRQLGLVDESSGKNTMFATVDTSKSVSVECTTLESIIYNNGIDHCSLLKIDCEGAEYEILYNLPEKYFRDIERIFLEYHTVEGESAEELKNFLLRQGYAISVGLHPSMLYAERSDKS